MKTKPESKELFRLGIATVLLLVSWNFVLPPASAENKTREPREQSQKKDAKKNKTNPSAPDSTMVTESDREIIEKARLLLLQKERSSAQMLLVSAIQKEEKRGNLAGVKSLRTALEEISTIFLLDKAQQGYELALSFLETEPTQALNKLEDVAKLEPKNLAVEAQMARTMIILGSCKSALEKAKSILQVNPHSSDGSLVLLQAEACIGNPSELHQAIVAAPVLEEEFGVFKEIVLVQDLFLSGTIEPAREKLLLLLKQNEAFPEIYYWLWKIDPQATAASKVNAQKYLGLCKNPQKGIVRKFLREPSTCRRMGEVEAFLSKQEG